MASLFPRALLRRPLTASAALSRPAATASRASTCRAPTTATASVSSPRPAFAPSSFRQLTARRFYSEGPKGSNNSSGIPPPPPPPPPKPSNIKFWPFIVVIALGSGGYMLLVNQRNNSTFSLKETLSIHTANLPNTT